MTKVSDTAAVVFYQDKNNNGACKLLTANETSCSVTATTVATRMACSRSTRVACSSQEAREACAEQQRAHET